RHRRALEDPDASLQRDTAQPAREQRGLYRRGRRLEDAAEVRRLAGAAGRLLRREALERLLSVGRDRVERLLPRAELSLARRGPEPAVAAVVRIDPVLGAERADPVHRLGGRTREPHGLLAGADFLQRAELGPPAEHEAAVPPARAAAADVRLDERDVE